MTIYAKLNAARAKLHALKLEKTGYNKFAGYAYFELGDFLLPALRIFDEVGLCAVVSFNKDCATMEIVDANAPMTNSGGMKQSMTITSPLPSSFAPPKGMTEIQHIGSCETFSRRYLWMTALEIVEHDALDATTGKDQKDKTGAPVNHKVSATEEAFKSMQPEDQDYCRKIAAAVVAAMPDVSRVVDMLDNEGMDNEQKIGVWHLLDSGTRSAIKKAQDAQKAAI